MDSVSEIRSVTLVRETLAPSELMEKLIRELAIRPLKELRIYTTARRVLELKGDYPHPTQRYAEQFRRAETNVRSLAQSALQLSGVAEIQQAERSGRPSRLYLEPRQQEHLDVLVDAMKEIPTIDTTDSMRSRLYVDFPPNTMTADSAKREAVLEEMAGYGRHPATRRSLTATSPHIISRDLPRFALRHPAIIPDDGE